MTKPKNTDLLPLLEREIRKVLRDSKATRQEKLKAIEAGSRVVMTKHKITEATDGAAGAFFATREPSAWGGPERAIRRPAPEPAAAQPRSNGASPEGGAAPERAAGGPEEPGGTDPPADPV